MELFTIVFKTEKFYSMICNPSNHQPFAGVLVFFSDVEYYEKPYGIFSRMTDVHDCLACVIFLTLSHFFRKDILLLNTWVVKGYFSKFIFLKIFFRITFFIQNLIRRMMLKFLFIRQYITKYYLKKNKIPIHFIQYTKTIPIHYGEGFPVYLFYTTYLIVNNKQKQIHNNVV